MPKFIKQILRPGTYVVRTADGKRRSESISRDRIRRWVTNFSRMIGNGLRIPAPYEHQTDAVPADKEPTAYRNGGWWSRLWQEADGSLYGELDAPNPTDAEKIGTTVVEVSPSIRPEFVDGKGNRYEDSIYHIALVMHPVAPGQPNFEPALGLSFSLSDQLAAEGIDLGGYQDGLGADTSGDGKVGKEGGTKTGGSGVRANAPSMKDVLEALKKVKLVLPEDTDATTLAERIIVAAAAIEGSKEDEENPEGKEPKEQPAPIVMGDDDVSDEILKQQLETEKKRAKAALDFASTQAKSDRMTRIENLVKSGRVNKKYATEKLVPQLAEFQLSLDDDGKPQPHAIDAVLDALEATPGNSLLGNVLPPAGRKVKANGVNLSLTEEDLPDYDPNAAPESVEDVDKIIAAQFASAGMKPR